MDIDAEQLGIPDTEYSATCVTSLTLTLTLNPCALHPLRSR